MRGLILRGTVTAGAALALLIPAATASASSPPSLGWTPTTSAGTYNYGTVAPGSATPQTFTLKNSGGSASAALTVTVKGSAAFTKTADTCTGTSLGPGKSCTVTVTYRPTGPGQADQATLTATSPKPATTAASLTLTGTAAKATPAIATAQQPASATVGTAVADKATVSGGSNPAGTVTFTLYNNSGCTGTALFTDNETLSGGTATSKGYTTTATGTDYWTAAYNGNAANNAVTSGCAAEPVTITPATPGIATAQQPATGPVNTVIADQATVTGGSNPTGTVTFTLYDNPNCGGTPLFTDPNEALVNGVATSSGIRATGAFTGYWVASYNGDTNNNPVTSGCADEPVTITPAQTALTTTQQPATATVGTAIADQATLTGTANDVSGTITFNLYDNPNCTGTPLFTQNVGLTGGDTVTSASYTTTAVGTDYWTASYGGDSNNLPTVTGCGDEPVIITPATPAIATAQQPASATVGSSVADKATVSGGSNPTGTVTFVLYNNSGCTGTPLFTDTEPLTGGAATSAGYTATASGTDYWAATYNGDASNFPVTSGCAAEPVTITGTPDLTVSPGTLTGTGGLGKEYNYIFPLLTGSSETTTFTITNSGSAASQTLQLLIDDHPGFSTTNDMCSGHALAPGATCTFDVTFSTAGCADPLNGPLVIGDAGASYISLVEIGECP